MNKQLAIDTRAQDIFRALKGAKFFSTVDMA